MTLTIKPPAWHGRFAEPPQGAMVLVAAELLLDLVDRANPDVALSVAWGEPIDSIDGRPIYEPTLTRHAPRDNE